MTLFIMVDFVELYKSFSHDCATIDRYVGLTCVDETSDSIFSPLGNDEDLETVP